MSPQLPVVLAIEDIFLEAADTRPMQWSIMLFLRISCRLNTRKSLGCSLRPIGLMIMILLRRIRISDVWILSFRGPPLRVVTHRTIAHIQLCGKCCIVRGRTASVHIDHADDCQKSSMPWLPVEVHVVLHLGLKNIGCLGWAKSRLQSNQYGNHCYPPMAHQLTRCEVGTW